MVEIRRRSKPPARSSHTACCIRGRHPVLVVVGGLGDGCIVYSDVWVLDIEEGIWTLVWQVLYEIIITWLCLNTRTTMYKS